MKQKTEITFEVEETIILRQTGKRFEAFCPQCAASVEMLTPQTVATLTGLSEREIFRLIENQKVHFIETGRVLICSNCLPISKEK